MTTGTEVQAPEGYVFICERDAIPARGKKTVRIGEITLLLIACKSGLYAVEDRCPDVRIFTPVIDQGLNGDWKYFASLGETKTGEDGAFEIRCTTDRELFGKEPWLWICVWS